MARKAARRGKTKNRFDDNNVISLESAKFNMRAEREGPRKKTWSLLDIKSIRPKTDRQADMIESYLSGNHIVADGSAGTGKTYVGLWLALNTILDKESNQNKIIIVRSNVGTGKEVGHLPGDLVEKMAPFETPYRDVLADLLGKPSSYDDMKEADKVEFMPVAFIRGLSWDNAVVVIDEAQNMDAQTLHTIMTRIGKNTRVIVCGDRSQNDLRYDKKTPSGFDDMIRIVDVMESMDRIIFTKDDIVRSGFVKQWIIAKEDLGL